MYVHDDSGRGSMNGRLPFQLDDTFIPERKFESVEGSGVMVTWMPTTTQGFFVQCWPKFGGAEICKTRSTMGMSKQEHLRIVVCGQDDSDQGITTGHRGGIPERKLNSAEDSCMPRSMFFVLGQTFRQTPCTMVKISVQQRMAETIYQNLGTTPSVMSNDVILMLSLVFDIAILVVSLTECPNSEFNLESYLKDPKRMRSNTTITGDHKKTVFLGAFLPVAGQACPRTRTTSHTSGRYERFISPMENL